MLTKWVADAWDNVDPAVIIRGFKKCAYSVALDGSENDEVHIEKLDEYIMPNPSDEDGREEYTLLDSDDDDDSYGYVGERLVDENENTDSNSDE